MVRTKSAAVFDPPVAVECPVVTGYCGVDSAELRPVSTGDLGRCVIAASIAAGPMRQDPLRTCPAVANWGCTRRSAC